MSVAFRFLPALVALPLLVACPPGEPAKDGETGDTADTGDTGEPTAECGEVDPVTVTVTNDRGWYIDDSTVTWATNAGSGTCDGRTRDTWRCDVPAEGDLALTVTHPLHDAEIVTVAATDGCRATSEPITVALTAAGAHFEASRMYYHQKFEDDEECANSWELYGVGCYYTAAFCADGYTAVMITDIVNFGVYDIGEEGRIGNTTIGPGDIPEDTTWTTLSATELEDWSGLIWELDTEDTFELYDCNE